MMSLYALNILATVVDLKSFSLAARTLNLSVSAVSHTISRIESDYGFPLFDRSRKTFELTQNGKILLPYMKNLLKCNDALDQKVSSLKDLMSGIVRIVSYNSACRVWIPEIISRFHQKYPEIAVHVQQTGDKGIKEVVDAGDADLAIGPSNIMKTVSFLPLYRMPLICVVPADYCPLNGESITREDLLQNQVILQASGYDTEPAQFLADQEIPLDSTFRIETDETCQAFVEHGMGIFITVPMASYTNNLVKRYPLEPPTYRTIGLTTVSMDYITPAASLFRQEIIDYFNENKLINI